MSRRTDPPQGRGTGDDPVRRSPYSRVGAPAPVVVAAALVALEGAVSLGLAVMQLVTLDTASSDRTLMGVGGAAFFLVYGAALLLCAWGVARLRPWARSPVLLAQLLTLGIAWNNRGTPTTLLAVAGAVAAIVVLAGLLHPASVEALNRPEHRRDA